MWRGVAWLTLGGGWVLACGGRYERTPQDSEPASLAGSDAGVGGTTAGSPATIGGSSGGGSSGADNIGVTSGSGGVSLAECVDRLEAYRRYRAEVLAEFGAFPCKADAECRGYYAQSPCEPGCVLLTSAANRGIIDRLNAFGTSQCNPECWPGPVMACPPPPAVHCLANVCQ